MTVNNSLPPLEHQVGWLFAEMGTGDGGNVAGTFRNNPGMSVSEATIAFENQFERSADTVGSSGMNQRINFANTVYNSYNNGTLSSQPSNVQYVFNQALAQGYTPQQAAGIVGNLQRESSPDINPYLVNPNDAGPGNDSMGIAQWNRGRLANMINYDPATGAVVPNEFVQEGDIGSDGEPLTAEEAEEIREEARARSAVRGTSFYQPNELNDLDSYTYNWAIHIIHPRASHLPADEIVRNSSQFITLAQSGVENEITIDSVTQYNTLTFSRENRSAVANLFEIELIEPAGFTMYNRLLYAADQLGIETYIKACYILELNIRGWRNGQAITVGPFYWNCMAESLPMQYRDGASFYSFKLYETHQAAYNRLEFHLLQDSGRISASTYGDFLSQFEEIINEQARLQVRNAPGQIYPTIYKLETDDRFSSWTFDAATGTDLTTTRGVSVTGSGGTLDFEISQGTSITAAMSMALFHTRDFRRVLTTAGYALDEPADPEADPQELINLTQWVTYDTEVLFRRFDPLIKDYEKILTYRSRPYIAPEIIHDPLSFENLRNDIRLQRRRLANIFDNGLLRKRYDYVYTGKNTEVINLNIEFNNAFYTIQSLNSGAIRFPGSVFAGVGGEALAEIDNLRADAISVRNRVSQLNREIERATEELREIEQGTFEGPAARAISDRISEFAVQRAARQDQLQTLEADLDRRFDELRQQGENAAVRSIDQLQGTRNRYITQSEVTSTGSRIPPNTFRYYIVDSLATNGPEHGIGETPIGAAKLGAIEMNLLSLGDLLEIEIEVRGDPYWLGSNSEFDLGGPCFFLNLNFPTYPDEVSGLMNNVGDFSISGVYRVTEVTNYYRDGAWTQVLKCFLDTNTNYQGLREELIQGYVQDSGNASGIRSRTPVDADGDGTISDEELADFENNPNPLDTTAIGADTPGGHEFDPRLNANLANLLAASADATGVTIGNRSGVRPYNSETNRDSAGSSSGRHVQGNAMDVELYSNGRLLSVTNPADRAIIQNFTSDFVERSRAAGYQPSVGWANHTDRSNLYMGGDAGHFDIAAGQPNPSRRGAPIGAGYWGNGESSGGAPAWLAELF